MENEIDLSRVRTVPFVSRKRKVSIENFASPCSPAAAVSDLFGLLPNILKGKELIELIQAIVQANAGGKPVILFMGAHLIKVGLSRVIIDLVNHGVISAVATNGAGAVHDFEISMWGETSEDVAEGLEDGSFGVTDETGRYINQAVEMGKHEGWGFGESIARQIERLEAPHRDASIFYAAYGCRIPITVHVALGTDVFHQHPSVDGAAMGETSLRDFRILSKVVSDLGQGGVVLNFGSAVILPEVFLKALNVARNVGYPAKNFTTANFDMIQHYRPNENLVRRPVLSGGKGYSFTGHHEIMMPLLAVGVKAGLEGGRC